MNSRNTKLMLIVTAIVVPLAILLWFNQDAVWAFLDFVRDRNAISAFIDEIGFVGPLVLMGLLGLQVLIPWIPSEPPIIAAGYAYGFVRGFLMSWLVSVAATQAAYYLARFAGRPVVERFVPANSLDKWTGVASKGGAVFFMIVFMNPLLPTDMMVFVAGLSAIEGRRFFVANLLGRMPLVALLTLVGSSGFRITPAVIVGFTVACVLMLVAWWYLVRERPEAGASTADRQMLAVQSAVMNPFRLRRVGRQTTSATWPTRMPSVVTNLMPIHLVVAWSTPLMYRTPMSPDRLGNRMIDANGFFPESWHRERLHKNNDNCMLSADGDPCPVGDQAFTH